MRPRESGKPRIFILTSELRRVLEAQIKSIEQLKAAGTITPFVFHRQNGARIKCLRKAFLVACERRTSVRNLERAGVARSTAMAMVGHETEAIYKRYAIQDETMLREGAAKLDAFLEKQAGTTTERKAQLRQFKATGKERLKSAAKTA